MKTNRKTLALLLIAGFCMVNRASAQPIDSVTSLSNSAVAASPRAKELFPELTRTARVEKRSAAGRGEIIRNQRGIAANPRAVEQFPELVRQWKADKGLTKGESAVLNNRALAASPRVKEQYPWLARLPSNEAIQVAPLK